MVNRDPVLREKIIKVITFLKDKIELTDVILFGSYAYGKPNKLSDIDLAVISPDFDQMSLESKAALFAEVKTKCDIDVEIHPFGIKDLEKARKTNFLGEIKNRGLFYLKNKKIVA